MDLIVEITTPPTHSPVKTKSGEGIHQLWVCGSDQGAASLSANPARVMLPSDPAQAERRSLLGPEKRSQCKCNESPIIVLEKNWMGRLWQSGIFGCQRFCGADVTKLNLVVICGA